MSGERGHHRVGGGGRGHDGMSGGRRGHGLVSGGRDGRLGRDGRDGRAACGNRDDRGGLLDGRHEDCRVGGRMDHLRLSGLGHRNFCRGRGGIDYSRFSFGTNVVVHGTSVRTSLSLGTIIRIRSFGLCTSASLRTGIGTRTRTGAPFGSSTSRGDAESRLEARQPRVGVRLVPSQFARCELLVDGRLDLFALWQSAGRVKVWVWGAGCEASTYDISSGS